MPWPWSAETPGGHHKRPDADCLHAIPAHRVQGADKAQVHCQLLTRLAVTLLAVTRLAVTRRGVTRRGATRLGSRR